MLPKSDAVVTVAVMTVLWRTAAFAVSKPSRETLFGAMSRAEKYACKPIIDSVVSRVGAGAGALVHAGLARDAEDLRLFIQIAISAVWVAITVFVVGRWEAKVAKNRAHSD
jgi:ATP/ADP translocase